MCLAIPMKLISREEDFGIVEYKGISRKISLHLIEDVKNGDFLIVHAGVAISKINQVEAKETLNLFKQIMELES